MYNIDTMNAQLQYYYSHGFKLAPFGLVNPDGYTVRLDRQLDVGEYPLPDEVQSQVDLAVRVRDAVMLIDPGLCLWGGAPRNWFFRKLANDVDIFFYTGKNRRFAKHQVASWIEHALRVCGLDTAVSWITPTPGSDDYENRDESIICVYEFEVEGTKFQAIHCNTTCWHRDNTSPLNMCSVKLSGSHIEFSDEFFFGVTTRTLYKLRDPNGREGEYIQKIRSYFPDYKWVASDNGMAKQVNHLFPWREATPEDPFGAERMHQLDYERRKRS